MKKNYNIFVVMILILFSSKSFAQTNSKLDFSAAKIDPKDVSDAILESQATTESFMPKSETSPAVQKMAQAMADSMVRQAKMMRDHQWPEMVVSDHEPSDRIFIKSVKIDFDGYIAIEYGDVVGVSSLLKKGINTDISIKLNRKFDGTSVLAYLYRDNGDGVFDAIKDEYAGNNGRVFKEILFTTKRNLKNAYYSTLVKSGGASLIFREQPAGDRIDYIDSNFGSIANPYFVAIFKDKNGAPGEFIGNSGLSDTRTTRSEVKLIKSVSNEMLYAVIFLDNGDGKFDLASDKVLRGYNNMIIIVKFKVV